MSKAVICHYETWAHGCSSNKLAIGHWKSLCYHLLAIITIVNMVVAQDYFQLFCTRNVNLVHKNLNPSV